MKNELKFRELFPGGPLYAGDPVCADSLCLAAFLPRKNVRLAAEFGCGSGLMTLLLLWEDPLVRAKACDLRPAAAEECRENLRANGWEERGEVRCGDLREEIAEETFDLIFCNPPYFRRGTGRTSTEGDRALMREETASFPELCSAVFRSLRPGGSFCFVHRTGRMAELFGDLRSAGLEPKRLRLILSRIDSAPELFLCEAVRGASPGLRTEPVLLQYGPDGRETAEYRHITHWEA